MIIDLNLKDKQVLVVGGGNEAARKVEALLTQQCKIIVVAEKVNKSIKQHAKSGKITLELKKISDVGFINKYQSLILILATTDDREKNREIVRFGKSIRCYVYAADDPEESDFSHPSVINVGDAIEVAISTGGKSPLIGKTLREKIEPIIINSINNLVLLQIKLQDELRSKAKKTLLTPKKRKKFLVELLNDPEVNEFLKEKKYSDAFKIAIQLLDSYTLKDSKVIEN